MKDDQVNRLVGGDGAEVAGAPGVGSTVAADVDTAALQRGTIRVLATSQVAGGLGTSSAVAVGAVLVDEVFDRADLSGLMQSTQVLGAAVLALPAAALSIRFGRRAGLAAAYGSGAVGSALVALAAHAGWLVLVIIGAGLLGGATAASLQARYAATDLADESHRGRALSLVVWMTTIGAVVGPNLIGPSSAMAEGMRLEPLAGPFLVSAVVLAVGAVIITGGLRPDPLLTARALEGSAAAAPVRPRRGIIRAGWVQIAARPPAVLAVAAIVVAHTVMVSVMVMTPIHMNHGGASISIIGFVISIHVVGMYAFSPVVGWIADRIGPVATILVGLVVLLVAVVLSGTSNEGHSAALTVGLLLLGVGWSLMTISGSVLVTDVVPLSDRPAVQGASDLLMGLAAAGGGAVAGLVVGGLGYGALNVGAGALLVIPAALAAVPACRAYSNSRSA